MIIKYDMQIDNNSIEVNLKRITNQIYKLLPNREEGIDWKTPLTTIMEELKGIQRLIKDYEETFFSLISKLEGLFTLTKENDFFLYRRTIFECLSLMNILIKKVDVEVE